MPLALLGRHCALYKYSNFISGVCCINHSLSTRNMEIHILNIVYSDFVISAASLSLKVIIGKISKSEADIF